MRSARSAAASSSYLPGTGEQAGLIEDDQVNAPLQRCSRHDAAHHPLPRPGTCTGCPAQAPRLSTSPHQLAQASPVRLTAGGRLPPQPSCEPPPLQPPPRARVAAPAVARAAPHAPAPAAPAAPAPAGEGRCRQLLSTLAAGWSPAVALFSASAILRHPSSDALHLDHSSPSHCSSHPLHIRPLQPSPPLRLR